MPAPLARDRESGTYLTFDTDAKSWRPLNDEEFSRLRPSKVLDEMGVSSEERFIVKNFLNAGTASMWLRARGFQVLPYGTGLNFAVRRSDQEPWRVLDPAKGGVGEFMRDIWDISVGDVALPALGAALGAPGGVLGGAAGLAGAEAVRQGIGAAITGDLSNIDPVQIGAVGATGVALPPVAGAVGRTIRGVAGRVTRGLTSTGSITRGAETFLSRVVGIKPGQNVRVLDILMHRARAGNAPDVVPADVVSAFRAHMDEVAQVRIGDLTGLRDTIAADASVNVRPVIESVLTASRGERTTIVQDLVGLLKPRSLRPDVAQLQSEINALLDPPTWSQAQALADAKAARSVIGMTMSATRQEIQREHDTMISTWLTGLESMPAPAAMRVRTVLQAFVNEAGGYVGLAAGAPGAAQPITREFGRDVRGFARKWISRVHDDLDRQGLQDVRTLDSDIHDLATARDGLRKYFGVERESAEATVINAFAPKYARIQDALRTYDAAFPGTEWRRILRAVAGIDPRAAAVAPVGAEPLARQSFIGSRFTPQAESRATFGFAPGLARATAAGTPIGTAFVGGAIGGATSGPFGGLVGGLAGGTVGFLAASPAVVVKAAPMIVRGGRVIRGIAGRVATVQAPPLLGPVTRAAAQVSLAGIARSEFGKTLVRNEVPRPRRRVLNLTGQ